MHISDGLRAYGIDRKTVIVVVLLPFLLVSLNCVEASPEKDLASPSHVSLGDSILVAGMFQYLDVIVPTEHEKICVIAFNGITEPELQNRSERNYYQWEYDNGIWKDTSGYDSSYIDPSQCTKDNATYSFCLRISQKANPGSWTIKILVDDKETSSISFQVIIGDFCLFFSTIIGVFEPSLKQKNLLPENEVRCCDKERKQETSEANIEELVDSVLKQQATISNEEKSEDKTRDLYSSPDDFVSKQESLRTAISLYPRSKLKEIHKEGVKSVFFSRIGDGGKDFFSLKSDGFKKIVMLMVLFIFLSACMLPMVVMKGKSEDSRDITIINVQSFPQVGGEWIVRYSTVGRADLIITASNGTSWSNTENCSGYDLRFLSVGRGNQTLYNTWTGSSVIIENYSSNSTGYEISRVLTAGTHTLRFQFGDDVAYAYNDASAWWNTSWLYRKKLIINNKNIGYQMKIVVGNVSGGNVSCNGHAKSNFGDIRFISFSDNSTQLSYWMKNYTSNTQATFWINNSLNDSSIWMYYGNSGVSSRSNGSNTFYFFDDFSNGLSKWVMESWNTDSIYINQSQGNSAPALRHNPDNSIPANRTYQDTRIRTNYRILNGIIEYDVYLAGTPRIIHQFGWRANGLSWTNGYCWRLQNSAADGGFFEFSAPTTWTQIGTAFPLVSTGVWYHVKINVSGAAYSAKITPSAPAGDSARSVTDSTKTTADYLVSHVHGVSMTSANYVLVDNVLVRKYYATPPTWSSFGQEEIYVDVSNPFPSQNATGVSLNFSNFSITVQNDVSRKMNITWRTNTSGSWVTFNTTNGAGSGVGNGTYTATNISWVNAYSKKYWWRVCVSYGTGWTNETFYFTTNHPPSIALIYPKPNGTTATGILPICKIWANDTEGAALDVYWYENTTGVWFLRNTNSSVSANSTVSYIFSQFDDFAVTYYWKVAVNDSMSNVSAIFHFTAMLLDTSVNPISPFNVLSSPLVLTVSNYSTLDNITLWYRYSTDNSSWTAVWNTLYYDGFEDGTSGNYSYAGDGSDATVDGTGQIEGAYSLHLQDNSGTYWYLTNNISAATHDYTSIRVDFQWKTYSFENNEDWFFEYYDDSAGSWTRIDEWVAGTDFPAGDVNTFGTETFYLNESEGYNLSDVLNIRFYCDASNNADELYIDSIYINATNGWQIWSDVNNPDENSPWAWNFAFPSNIGYYEFYSIGKKTGFSDEQAPQNADARCYYNPGGNAPTITLISPAPNGTNNVDLLTPCGIWANDTEGATLDVYWYENTTGGWVLRNTNSSVNANSTVSHIFLQFEIYSVTYYWKVAVNDSTNNISAIFHFTIKFLNTSVNPISPYNVTSSLLVLTASNYTAVDNVTLYYRWSDRNFTGSDTLTYDDFEFGWGNFTDGGVDCSRYTGGTYAHQGSSAADIQDNSGVASSFYLTNAIDLEAPGYNSLSVEFWFYAVSMDNTEDFWVRYNDGTGWVTLADYVVNIDFINGQFYHKTIWINQSTYNLTTTAQIMFQCDASGNGDDIYIDQIWINATTVSNWIIWNDTSNPDLTIPWSWDFDFPNGTGYYEFYSIGKRAGSSEQAPLNADTKCFLSHVFSPIINFYDLRNSTGSKRNNITGLLDVNNEYMFTISITDGNGWIDVDYINITAWYDYGNETSSYNSTLGGNINMFLQYINTTGIAQFRMLWPDDEVQIIGGNCSETLINSTTRIVNISFKPGGQTRWAYSNNTWDSTQNTTNDPFSWNFNITARAASGLQTWKKDEYGIYKFATIFPEKNWVDVEAPPGYFAKTNIVNVTYSSNYNFNISIFFEENLTNVTSGDSLPIANNVYICANADFTDDITADMMFHGIREANAIDIINTSGIFHKNNTIQVVQVQFNVYIPFGTNQGHYTAHVATKIKHKEK